MKKENFVDTELSLLKHKLNFHANLNNIGNIYVPLTLVCFFISFVFCVIFAYTDDFCALALSITFLLIEWIFILDGIDKMKRLNKYYGY